MGTIKKIGAEYYIEFEARGLKYQQKAGPDEAAARRLLEEVEGKIKKGEMGVLIRDADIDIFLADFIQFAGEQHSPRSLKRFQSVAVHFHNFLKKERPHAVKLSQITPVVLEQYKDYLNKSGKLPVRTANREKLINLSFFLLFEIFQYAIKLGYLNDNPALHIRLLKIPAGPRPSGLTERERQMFFAANGTAEITRLFNALQKRPGNTEALCLQFQELLYNCGLKSRAGLGCLRHTFALDLLKKGVSVGALYKYLGLPDIARVMVYAPFVPQKRRELYEDVNPRL